MRDAEALLLVDDEEPEVAELDVLGEQAVRADDDVQLAFAQVLERLGLLGLRAEAAHHVDAHGERREPRAQRLEMLQREHRRRREHGDLLAVHHGLERGAHRDLRLAEADVAAHQAIHGDRRLHVALDVLDGAGLIGRELVGERELELLLPVRVGRERVTLDGLARGVELEQLVGHVAHGLLDARLGLLPRRAAEAVERRVPAARELLHEVEPVDRDEQLVVAGVAQLHELARLVPDVDLLEPDEHADAVVDVDDVIADLEIAEVREEGLRGRRAALVADALLVEDVGLGKQPHLRGGQAEALRQLAGRDEQCAPRRDLRAADVHRHDAVVAQDLDDAFGAARGLGDEHGGLALLAALAELGHPVGDAAVEGRRGLAGDVAFERRGGLGATSGIASSPMCGSAAKVSSLVAVGSIDMTSGHGSISRPGGSARSSRASASW